MQKKKKNIPHAGGITSTRRHFKYYNRKMRKISIHLIRHEKKISKKILKNWLDMLTKCWLTHWRKNIFFLKLKTISDS